MVAPRTSNKPPKSGSSLMMTQNLLSLKSSPSRKRQSSKPVPTTSTTKITIKPKKGPPEDDEEAPTEEHVILRIPAGEMAERFKEQVKTRDIPEDVELVFQDSRRATFRSGGTSYPAKLVDLPCIIESHKTFDKKQMYKIADISQMILVDDTPSPSIPLPSTEPPLPPLHHDEYTYPHGLSAPLWNVRKRRFRKRVSKRAIEDVEREVVRLLEADAEAEQVLFEVDDGEQHRGTAEDDLLDEDAYGEEEEEEEEEEFDEAEFDEPNITSSQPGDEPLPAPGEGEEEEDDDEHDELAAAWDEALAEHGPNEEDAENEEEATSSEDGSSGSESEEEEEETESAEIIAQKVEVLSTEIKELEDRVEDNRAKLAVQINPIMRKRFEDIVKRFNAQLTAKRAELVELQTTQMQ
ncbi:TAFII55 protein conserved region-domain-containing protein [Phlyctochytrium arcticum]|nr:TAFII55 protein conserved region-domain-containing protein [Phlyctochytrium arcticum]